MLYNLLKVHIINYNRPHLFYEFIIILTALLFTNTYHILVLFYMHPKIKMYLHNVFWIKLREGYQIFKIEIIRLG